MSGSSPPCFFILKFLFVELHHKAGHAENDTLRDPSVAPDLDGFQEPKLKTHQTGPDQHIPDTSTSVAQNKAEAR